MIILGIAGVPGSERHALATAKAINEIKPTHLSALSLMLYRGSELKGQFERGEFTPLTPAGLMEELKVIIEHLDLPETEHMIFRSNHVSTTSASQQHCRETRTSSLRISMKASLT